MDKASKHSNIVGSKTLSESQHPGLNDALAYRSVLAEQLEYKPIGACTALAALMVCTHYEYDIQWCQLLLQQGPVYEVKVTTSDGYSTI